MPMVLVASGLAHVGLFAVLAQRQPQLQRTPGTPPIEVEVVPMFVPKHPLPRVEDRHAQSRPPGPRRARRPDDAPTPRVGVPELPRPRPADVGVEPMGPGLRSGAVGCATPGLLDRSQRDKCDEAFGAGAQTAAFVPSPIERDRRREFDDKVSGREQMRIYRQTGIFPGLRESLKAAK